MRLQLLGSGGFVPTDRRETACALVRDGDDALLIDAGTGARRLLDEPGLLRGVDRLSVLLTHFHLDHVVGLFYLAALEVPLEIWGAGEALEDSPTAELVRRLLSSPFAPPSFVERFTAVHELELGETEIGRFAVRARVQRRHANPTLALRIGDDLAWCTDTAYDVANAEFAGAARLLCHEAFYAADRADDTGHTAAGEAGRLAAAAGVERLLLIHINPELADDDALLAFARNRFAAAEVGVDGLETG
jgi:ribonuclease BN (tRNA processing enzyme)